MITTSHDELAHAPSSLADHQKPARQHRSIIDALAMPDASAVEFDPPRADAEIQPAEFA